VTLNRNSLFNLIFLVSCTACTGQPAAAPDRATDVPNQQLVDEFRARNRMTFTNGVPGPSELPEAAVQSYCKRFMAAAQALVVPGLSVELEGPCRARVSGSAPLLRDVAALGGQAVFDVRMFTLRPYAAASYDTETRTLHLPLSFVVAGRLDDDETEHEHTHIAVHQRLLAHSREVAPFGFVFAGPSFRPDSLHADELFAYTADLCRMARGGRMEAASARVKPFAMHVGFTVKAARAALADRPDAEIGPVTLTRIDDLAPNAPDVRAALAELAALAQAMESDLPALTTATARRDAPAILAWGAAHLPLACAN
jgi:hypothetical protein